MIKYRPHRGSLGEAMKEAREFETTEEMKKFIMNDLNNSGFGKLFDINDIVIGDVLGDDDRIGWKNVRHVCIKRIGDADYMKAYGSPQCIGWCGE